MYYLQSRYYDPTVGRFINADEILYVLLSSDSSVPLIYAYCNNNPVNNCDPFGYETLTTLNYTMGFKQGLYPFVYKYRDTFYYNPYSIPTNNDFSLYGAFTAGKYIVQDLLPNGFAFYRYFLSAKGGEYLYDYLDAFNEDNFIRKAIYEYIRQLTKCVVEKAKSRTACKMPWGYKPITYNLTSNLCVVNCETNDWKFALNTHRVGFWAEVKCEGFYQQITLTIYALDRYQFDKGQSFYGIPDEWNGRFVELGWAKFFNSVGVMHCDISTNITSEHPTRLRFY